MATYVMNTNVSNGEQGYASPPATRRGNAGRKKSKNEKKKKEPQRGMGVEKLEQMRIQEICKNPVVKNSDPNLFSDFNYAKFGGFPNGQMSVFGLGGGSGSAVSNEAFAKNVGWKFQSEYCTPSYCNKKTRYDGGYMFSNKGGFLGLSVGENNMMFNRQNLSPRFAYATQPGVEVLAVHKGPTNEETGNVVMEYEFFPSSRKDEMDENVVAAEASSSSGLDDDQQITTCLGIGVPGFDSSLDLSLKLSY